MKNILIPIKEYLIRLFIYLLVNNITIRGIKAKKLRINSCPPFALLMPIKRLTKKSHPICANKNLINHPF